MEGNESAVPANREQVVICHNCGRRPGTIQFGDMLSFTHGWAQMWCEVCVADTQLTHARERAAAIPKLARDLAEALDRDPPVLPDEVPMCTGTDKFVHSPMRMQATGDDFECYACAAEAANRRGISIACYADNYEHPGPPPTLRDER